MRNLFKTTILLTVIGLSFASCAEEEEIVPSFEEVTIESLEFGDRDGGNAGSGPAL